MSIHVYKRSTQTPRFFFFFFNDTATTEIYTLSLHDALPICHEIAGDVLAGEGVDLRPQPLRIQVDLLHGTRVRALERHVFQHMADPVAGGGLVDRKSTRLNSSHLVISYAVFCLKKKNK